MIDHSNFEAYLQDYLDDRLGEAERKSIESFLEMNPEVLDGKLKTSGLIVEADGSVVFQHKSLLKRDEEGISSMELRMIRALEGEISDDERIEFERAVHSNQRIRREWLEWKATIIPYDNRIRFPKKDRLKRTQSIITFSAARLFRITAAAAILAIVYTFWPATNPPPVQTISQNTRTESAINEKTSTTIREQPTPSLEPSIKTHSVQRQISSADTSLAKSDILLAETTSDSIDLARNDAAVHHPVTDTFNNQITGSSTHTFDEEIFNADELDELIELGLSENERRIPENVLIQLVQRVTGIRREKHLTPDDNRETILIRAGSVTARYPQSASK